jgi:hypothetical protein
MINLYNLHHTPENLDHYDQRLERVPKLAWEHGLETKQWNEKVLAKDPFLAFEYAHCILRDPFELGEPAIAKSSAYSVQYAMHVLKDRFPKGEEAISKDAFWSETYATNILKRRFKLGEPAIANDRRIAKRYNSFFECDI